MLPWVAGGDRCHASRPATSQAIQPASWAAIVRSSPGNRLPGATQLALNSSAGNKQIPTATGRGKNDTQRIFTTLPQTSKGRRYLVLMPSITLRVRVAQKCPDLREDRLICGQISRFRPSLAISEAVPSPTTANDVAAGWVQAHSPSRARCWWADRRRTPRGRPTSRRFLPRPRRPHPRSARSRPRPRNLRRGSPHPKGGRISRRPRDR